MSESTWVVGQRCASVGELALGLGIIREVTPRNIHVAFPATNSERTYSRLNAPLRRVRFEVGDEIQDNDGHAFVVTEIREQNHLLFYFGPGDKLLPETELDHTIVYNKPHQKLLAGYINKPKEFALRCKTWELKHRSLAHASRGFVGARIELVPHQLYIAAEVAKRRHPRVLLSDEVGLGKTIEAGLIFHRLWITGEVRRVLCLVPGTLVSQWLTEMYRKFNVLFNIMSEGHAREITKGQEETNPYQLHQTVLQSIESVVESPQLFQDMIEAPWDLVIVDEAHHLYWGEDGPSPEYQLVAELSKVCGGLLLLTATPRQLGLHNHFGRLQLLDPDRFDSYAKFIDESERYTQFAELADRVLEGRGAGVRAEIAALFPKDAELIAVAPDQDGEPDARAQEFIHQLIDRHGTGRMVFRNHRKVLSGFPKRTVVPVALDSNTYFDDFVTEGLAMLADSAIAQRLLAGPPAFAVLEMPNKASENKRLLERAWRQDPRMQWLLPFLRQNPDDKFLLIASRKSIALALQEVLAHAKDIEVAVFHEELSLLERDRQAAYFAKPDGARVLLCSEIGSEGRNFQFANKLILFDLPLNPALLEQRIGRLDRIGQHHDIEIYVPYPKGTPLEYLFRWYQEGLDAFEHHVVEGDYIYEHLKSRIFTIFDACKQPELMAPFIAETKSFVAELRETLQKGRDRLLEINSFDAEVAQSLIEEIEATEHDPELEDYMNQIFELYGVGVEDQAHLQTQILMPSPQMFVESFPGLPETGLEITYDRATAVAREELAFLCYDHPMVSGTIDMVLNQERGETSFALWKGAPEPGLAIECLYVLECHTDEHDLGLSRFLPPKPIRLVVDQTKRSRPDLLERIVGTKLDRGPVNKLHAQRDALTMIVESLLQVAEAEAQAEANDYLADAEDAAMQSLKDEYDRLKSLRAKNPSIRVEELEYIEETLNVIIDYIQTARLRLDAIRMILMVPQ